MARLAAYYQEDFHYPFAAPGHKQRKSAYVVYEEPKNNVFNSYSFNRERIRGLATSEPSLDFPQIRPQEMALQQRDYQHQGHVYQNYPYQFENVSNVPQSNHQYVRYEPEVYDNESLFSYHNELPQHDDRYNQRFRSRSRKRFSYAEPSDLHSPELMYLPQNGHRHRTKQSHENLDYQYYDERQYQHDNYFIEPISQCQISPMQYRPESRQGNWPKHHFIQTNANPVFLSPPSPLDSGLSSQSIGSNPSLDAEHSSEHLPVMRSGRHSACSCTRVSYCDNRPLNSQDFGEISPSAYSVSHRAVAPPHRHKKGTSNRKKYSTEDYDLSPQGESNVRYGKLGLIGEPTDNRQGTDDNQDLDNNKHQECDPRQRARYIYSDESDVPQRKMTAQRRKKSSSSNYTRPCVIVIEGPEKNNRQSSSSRDNREEELSDDKSQGPESPMSVTVSNSDSAPSSNEQDEPPREKTSSKRRQSLDKTAELEIKELEAMYERCNLGDRDLFDRAERRDLPTAHQQGRLLARSRSSDALCETSFRHNPYEPLRRAPPIRRSGMPDRVLDDMAMRKLQRPPSHSRRHHSNLVENPVTYMLCSAHFTPTVQSPGRDILLMGNPDVELDDLCYRKHYLGKEGKQDPEPPFGIPLRPPPPQKVTISDYLHAVPSSAPQPLCHPRGNPDVVRDDMAFRTLRKDEPERVYYDISQVYKHKNGREACRN